MNSSETVPSQFGAARRWLHDNSRVIAASVGLITLGGLLLGGLKWTFAPPDVGVRIENQSLTLPASLTRNIREFAEDTAVKTRLSQQTHDNVANVIAFLNTTKDVVAITVSNNTARSQTNIYLTLRNVVGLNAWAVDGDFLDGDSSQELLAGIKYDENAQVVTARGLGRLAPHSQVTYYLWGNFPYQGLSWQQVVVEYDGGTGGMERVATLRGANAFIYENADILIVLFVVVNCLVLSYAFERHSKKAEK